MTDLLAQFTTLDDLWHRFAAEHEIVWDTLTYDEYVTHAPTFGPWLIARLATTAPVAHVIWELLWAGLTAQPWRRHPAEIARELGQAGACVWATPFTVEASGFDALYVAVQGLVQVLQIADEEDREEADRRLQECLVAFSRLDPQTGLGERVEAPVEGQAYVWGVRLQDIVGHVAMFSSLPACQAHTHWYVHDFMVTLWVVRPRDRARPTAGAGTGGPGAARAWAGRVE